MNTNLLIVVDMQNGFVNSKSERALPGTIAAISHARESGVGIFFTRFLNTEDSQWERLIGWTRLRTSPEIDLHPDIASRVRHDEVVDKTTYTSLVGAVRDRIEATPDLTVAICGIATDGCVLKTAIDCFERGVRPVVLTDAVASHAGPEVHEAGLLLTGRFIGSEQLITVKEWATTFATESQR